MDDITLKVYASDMEQVEKECVANTVTIPFGIVRKFMKLFNVDTLNDTTEILKIVMNSWDEVLEILQRIFPEIQENEWDRVDIKELVSVLFQLMKKMAKELLAIPTDSKN